MLLLLYCRDGVVIGWHDSTQNVDSSAYGDGIRVVPYDQPLGTLPRVGAPPQQDGTQAQPYDPRPYAQPVETTAILIAFSAQIRWEAVTGGVAFTGSNGDVPANSDRVSQTLIANLAQYASTVPNNTPIDFTQDGTAYQITAQDAENLNTQISAQAQAARTIEAQCIADLTSATPTITTYADVEAKFAGVMAKTLRGAKRKKA